jgi:hypothetical protein
MRDLATQRGSSPAQLRTTSSQSESESSLAERRPAKGYCVSGMSTTASKRDSARSSRPYRSEAVLNQPTWQKAGLTRVTCPEADRGSPRWASASPRSTRGTSSTSYNDKAIIAA